MGLGETMSDSRIGYYDFPDEVAIEHPYEFPEEHDMFRAEIPVTKVHEKSDCVLDFETDVEDAAARLYHYFQKIGVPVYRQ